MSRPLFCLLFLGLTACSSTTTQHSNSVVDGSPHAHGFDAIHHYLPHDHAAHYYEQGRATAHQGYVGHYNAYGNVRQKVHEDGRLYVPDHRSPRHILDGIPMRMSAGDRSVYLPAAGPSVVGGQTQLQQHISAMAYRLLSSVHGLDGSTGIAVSGFVDQEDYRSQDSFSRFLSESMMFQLNQYGLRVIDFKTLPFIRITPQGDISASRDYRQLTTNLDARYLLHGTVTRASGGRMVNARLVRMGDNSLVASSQQFVPEYLASSVPKLVGPEVVMTPEQRSRYAK